MKKYGCILITEDKNRKVVVRVGIDRSDYLDHRKDSRKHNEVIVFSRYGTNWTEYYNKLTKIANKSLRLRKNLSQLESIIAEIKQETQ